jgi:hypothetical protein
MNRYVVEVSLATHEDLQRGCVESRRTRVVVLAEDDTDAVLLACQISHTTDGNRFPTGVLLVDFPTG